MVSKRVDQWETAEGKTNNITRDKFSGSDFLLFAVSDDNCLHGNIAFERGDDIGCLFFLIPTYDGVEQENTDDDTKIDPIS